MGEIFDVLLKVGPRTHRNVQLDLGIIYSPPGL